MVIEIESIPQPSEDERVKDLIARLNHTLKGMTGSDGSVNADLATFSQTGGLFLLALKDGEPVGCGGYRQLDPVTCEVKRMFSLPAGKGTGKEVLNVLEEKARDDGYQRIWLETRKINQNAIGFYLNNGFHVIENYGVYRGVRDAVCFEKRLKAGD